jgi:alpha-L-rhamnosidase
MGATTIWERWDSLLPDGSVNPGEMTSFNHYAFGAVADWMHRTVGGIGPAEPGYRQIEIAPRPGGGLTLASARHLTPYGMAECRWEIRDGTIEVGVSVPPNASARVTLPGKAGESFQVDAGKYQWSYLYQDPNTRQPLTVDSTIAEISNDPQAW